MDEQSIFLKALELQTPEERQAYLIEACGDNGAVRHEVEMLLKAHELAGDFLKDSPARTEHNDTIDLPVTGKPGDTIGPYKLLQQIGEGGMGVVYMAEQTEPIERRVALKIIKPGMGTRQVIARFEAERQALAMMDHPNIAKAIDAGITENGRPYFVMELVKGTPITQYCDEHHLTPRERLELFIPVCQAIQHAHHKGIIHRDIKPSNVLVADYDDQPVPKVIDFGVAKAVDHRLTEKTMFTEFGQVLGTFEYMSPEQAKLNQWDVDTRTDIYSLGVLLYELLAGETPFDRKRLRSAAIDELLRIIREEDPPRPSTRASTSQSLPTIADNRKTEPAKLSAVIRGDLDWIIMKALEKDRTRRYETANGLAMDLARHLNDEPVVAGPPLARYRLAKFVKRNKLQVMAGTAVATALVLALVGTSLGMAWALREQVRADAEFHRATAAALAEAEARQQAQENEQRAVKQKAEAEAAQQAAIQAEADARAAREEAEFRAYTASLAAAAADLQRNDARTLRRRLEQIPDQWRGWEWNYLWNESDRTLQTTLSLPPAADGYLMSLSRDASLVASRPRRGTEEPVTVYDARTGELVAEIATYSSNLPVMTFSSDNRLLAYHHSGTPGVQIFDVATGRGLVPRPHELLSFLGFYPNGERAVVLDKNGTVRVFKTADWSQVITLPDKLRNDNYYRRGAVSPDGKLLVIGHYGDDPMRVFDLATASLVKKFPELPGTEAIEFSDSGETVTILSFNGTITKYSTSDWEKLAETHEEEQRRGDLAVHRVDDRLVRMSFDSNGAVALYGFDKLTRSATLRGHGSPGTSIAVDPQLNQIVTAHADGAVCRWDLRRPLDLPLRSLAVAYSKDGSALHVGHDGRAVQTYEVNAISGQRQGMLGGHPETLAHGSAATQLTFSPNGRRLAVSTDSGWDHSRWRVYDLWTGLAEHDQVRAGIDGLKCIDWSPDGRWIAIGGKNDGTNVLLHDASDFQVTARLEAGTGGACAIVFSHDNQELVSASEDGTLDVWEVATGRLLRTAGKPGDPAIRCAAYAPDGQRLVTGSAHGTLAVWNPLDLTQVHRSEAHGAAVLALAFTPDGSRLLTSSADRSLKVFDPSGWRELVALHLRAPARSLDFSPDGKRLALAADAVRVLDAKPEAELARLRRVQREQEETANTLFQSVLEETADSVQVRRRIVEQTAANPSLQSAALYQWREWLGDRNFSAYGKWSFDWLNLEILRQRLDFQVGHDPTQDQIRRLTNAIRSSEDLDEIQRQALLDFVAAFVSERYQGLASNQSSLDSMRLAWRVVTNPERDADDYLAAYFGMGPVLQRYPNHVAYLATMAWAEYRAGLYEDAIETASIVAQSSVRGDYPAICLAVIAMAQHRIGKTDSAIATMRKLERVVQRLDERINEITIALANEAKKVIAAPLDAPWNEQVAWDSFQSRMEQALGESNCATCLAGVARRRSHRLSEQGANDAASKARRISQALLEKALAIDPKIPASANELAEILLKDTTQWTVLEPTEMNSAGGATLTRLADGSILASGENPLGDVYTIVAEADATRVTAVRIEALTHDSLPDWGPGRDAAGDRGNFAMTDWQVTSLAPGSEDESLDFRQAVDNPQSRFPVTTTGHWNVSGATSLPNTATFILQEPIDFQQRLRMKFRMRFSDSMEWPRQNLGRFRLSVSADPRAFDREAALQIADPWRKLAEAYRLSGKEAARARVLKAHPEITAELKADSFAAQQNWEQAIAAYNQVITPDTTDADLLAKRARAYAGTQQWDQSAADWVRVLDRSDDALPFASPKKKVCLALSAWPKVFRRVIEVRPEETTLWIGRGQHYALRSRWEQAAADYVRGFESRSFSDETIFEYAGTLLLSGDHQGYQQLCDEVLTSVGEPEDSWTPFSMARTCGVGPARDVPPKQLVDWATMRLVVSTGSPTFHVLGLAQYRAEQYNEAIASLEKSIAGNWGGADGAEDALNWIVLAVCHHQIGHVDKARECYAKAKAAIGQVTPEEGEATPLPVPDWIEWHVLLPQAEELLGIESDESDKSEPLDSS